MQTIIYQQKPLFELLLHVFSSVQCKKYRSKFTEEKKAVYEEKLEASEIFKDKKALYPSRYLKITGADCSLFHETAL